MLIYSTNRKFISICFLYIVSFKVSIKDLHRLLTIKFNNQNQMLIISGRKKKTIEVLHD